MEGDPTAYGMMKGIIDLITTSESLGWWFTPVFAIYLVLRVISWAYRSSRGERLDNLMESGAESVEALRRQPGRVSEAWRSRFR